MFDNAEDIKVLKLHPDAPGLTHGSELAAGVDVRYHGRHQIEFWAGDIRKLPTGWAFELPYNVAMLILPRSGLSTNQRLRPANTPGLLDPDYRGELFIALEYFAPSGQPVVVNPGDRIAQLLFVPFVRPNFNIVDRLGETDRGDGGFGSTGR